MLFIYFKKIGKDKEYRYDMIHLSDVTVLILD